MSETKVKHTVRLATAKEHPGMEVNPGSRRFREPTIVVDETETTQRVVRFELIDARLVLASDHDWERKSRRHAWKSAASYSWERLRRRGNSAERREVPQEAIDLAIEYLRNQIHYSETL